jgi:hypothetical protein
MPRTSSSTVTGIKLKAKCRIYAATIFLFYIPQKHHLKESCTQSNPNTVPLYPLLPHCTNKSQGTEIFHLISKEMP